VKQYRRRINISVTPQTLYHLETMAYNTHHGDIGRIVDDLVRERQMAARTRNKKTERNGQNHAKKSITD